jgi:hypothetical protein
MEPIDAHLRAYLAGHEHGYAGDRIDEQQLADELTGLDYRRGLADGRDSAVDAAAARWSLGLPESDHGEPQLVRDDRAWRYLGESHHGVRRLRVWRTGPAAVVAVVSERADRFTTGPSPANAAEQVAAQLAAEYPDDTVVYVEHCPAVLTGEPGLETRTWTLIALDGGQDMELRTGPTPELYEDSYERVVMPPGGRGEPAWTPVHPGVLVWLGLAANREA